METNNDTNQNKVTLHESKLVRRNCDEATSAKLVSHFGDKQGLNAGRPRGSKNRKTLAVAELLQQHDFDPVAMSVAIAQGEALTTKHPFLKKLREHLDKITLHLEEHNPPHHGVKTMLKNIWEDALVALLDSYVPIELRSKHIMDLLSYCAPKMKAIEHTIDGGEFGSAQPLTPADVEIFEAWFEDNY